MRGPGGALERESVDSPTELTGKSSWMTDSIETYQSKPRSKKTSGISSIPTYSILMRAQVALFWREVAS